MTARRGDWRHWTVAVTGVNARSDNPGPGLAVARCLREAPEFQGRLVGLGHDALDAGLYHADRFDGSCLLPYPTAGADALAERLRAIHALEPIDAVIPCLDAELATFVQLEPALAGLGIRTLLPSRHQIRERAKDNLPTLCRGLDIPTPETRPITDPAFFDHCAGADWPYPLVIKGIYYDAIVVGDPIEAKAAFRRIADQWGFPVLVQRFLAGHEVNLTAVGDGAGGLIGAVMMRKRAVTDKGKAWAGVAVQDEALERMASTLVAALRWRGPLEIEALRDGNGRLHLIEINPRFPAWVYLTHGVGRNLPAALLRLLADDRSVVLPPSRPGTMFIRHAEELIVGLDAFEAVLTDGGLDLASRRGDSA